MPFMIWMLVHWVNIASQASLPTDADRNTAVIGGIAASIMSHAMITTVPSDMHRNRARVIDRGSVVADDGSVVMPHDRNVVVSYDRGRVVSHDGSRDVMGTARVTASVTASAERVCLLDRERERSRDRDDR